MLTKTITMRKTILVAVAMMLGIAATAQITTQPAGELLEGMEYCSKGMVPDYTQGRITRFDQTGVIAHVVRSDNKIFIQDPITHYRVGTWMEGELSADDTQVVCHTPQVFTTEQGTTYYLYRMVQQGQSLGIDPANTDLVFSYADGTLTQTDGGYLSITDANGRTTSYVEYAISIRPIGQEVACPPADATRANYMMSYESEGAPQSQTIEVAFSGDEVFIANPTKAAGSWIHGSIVDGNRIVCPNSQFLGADESMGRYVYLKAAEGTVEVITIPGFGDWPVTSISLTDDEAVVFAWDAASRSFSTEQLFLVNGAASELGEQYHDYAKATFTPYEEVAAVPADPEVVSCCGIIEGYGFGLFAIDMPATDTQGNYINQENMYYNVYMDQSILQAPNGMTDIPYNYTDGQYIRVSGTSHTFTYTTPITERIGVQVFYRVGDVVNHSNLVWYDVDTEGIARVATDADIVSTEYFDLTGRRLNIPQPTAKGQCVVRRTTYADGTIKTTKGCF